MASSESVRYEVKDGRLYANGIPLPLGKGLTLVALLKAGWKGLDGRLDTTVARRLPISDPRVTIYARRPA